MVSNIASTLHVKTAKSVKFGESLHGTDLLLKQAANLDPTDRFDAMTESKKLAIKDKVIKQFSNPGKSTPQTIKLFNKLRSVGDYQQFLLGQFNPTQNKFHAFLLKNVGNGDMAKFFLASKKALNLPGNTPGILTPIKLNPSVQNLAQWVQTQTPQDTVRASLVREFSPEARKEKLGLTNTELIDIGQHGSVDNWLNGPFKKYAKDRQADIVGNARAHYTSLLWQSESERLKSLRQRHQIPQDQDELVVLRLSPSAAGDPKVFLERSRLARSAGSATLTATDPRAAVTRFNKAMGIEHQSSLDALNEGKNLLKNSAEFSSLNDGIIPIKPSVFLNMSEKQQADYFQDQMDRNGR